MKLDNVATMTSMEIAEITCKEHRNVLRDIRDEEEKLGTEISQLIFEQSEYTNERGRKYECYNLTRDGVLQIGARYDAKIRFTLIQRMNQLEEKANNTLRLPRNYKEALQSLLVEVEKNEVLTEIVEKQTPKVEYHDTVLKADKLSTASMVAKDLGMSAQAFNKKLHEMKIQYKKGKTWMFYAEHEDKVPKYADYHISEFGQTLKFTELGRKWIIESIEKDCY